MFRLCERQLLFRDQFTRDQFILALFTPVLSIVPFTRNQAATVQPTDLQVADMDHAVMVIRTGMVLAAEVVSQSAAEVQKSTFDFSKHKELHLGR